MNSQLSSGLTICAVEIPGELCKKQKNIWKNNAKSSPNLVKQKQNKRKLRGPRSSASTKENEHNHT